MLARLIAVCALSTITACAGGDLVEGATASDEISAGAANLVLGGWNVEFFGSPISGPVNDALQVANTRVVIEHLQPDVLGLEEIVSLERFEELKASLPDYDGFTVLDPRVVGGAEAYAGISSHLAILFKRTRVTALGAKVLPAIDPGRAPLEVELSVDVGGVAVPLVFMVVHLYPFAEPYSWQRRRESGDQLKAYLDANRPQARVAVVGDFNDDVDESIVAGLPTPFAQLRDDAAHYLFATRGLSVAGQATTIDHPSTIDHHLVTNELASAFVPKSAWVERPPYVANYGATTSDHYPVITRYAINP